jgi:acetyl-CoA acyltransferase
MREVYIVALGRSAIGKAPRGKLKNSRPEDIGAQVLKGVLEKVQELDFKDIDDLIMGCAFPEAEQGMNIAKIIAARAGLPYEVPAQTVNRFCSSGLQSITTGANSIIAGQSEVVVAGGVELMSVIPMGVYLSTEKCTIFQSKTGPVEIIN